MFKIDITVDRDVFDALTEQIQQAPGVLNRRFGQALNGIWQRAQTRLQTMPPPSQPGTFARHATPRQRRYVMAKLRKTGNIPYQRTGAYVKAWKMGFDATEDGGLFSIYNDARNSRGDYIEQYITGIKQQGFHEETGWYQDQTILSNVLVDAEDTLIDLWYEVTK